jgi:hypothetical protein
LHSLLPPYVGVREADNIGEGLKPGKKLRKKWDAISETGG